MLKNLRVVQISVLTNDPNLLIVPKMNSCPTAPQRQNSKIYSPACRFTRTHPLIVSKDEYSFRNGQADVRIQDKYRNSSKITEANNSFLSNLS